MKKFFLILLVATSLASCLNNTDKEKDIAANDTSFKMPPPATEEPIDSSKLTTVLWIDSAKDMGTVTEGELVKISYRFRNTGNKPLVIEKVQPACGCTVAEYPKEPIAPGKEGEIKAEFNSQGREGVQKKTVTVFANIPEKIYTLAFDVTVNKPKA